MPITKNPYGLDTVTRRHVPFQWLAEECRRAGKCGCGFCKSYAACEYGDCVEHSTIHCPVFGYRVCPKHYGANGLRLHGRRVYPQYMGGPAPAVGSLIAYRDAWNA